MDMINVQIRILACHQMLESFAGVINGRFHELRKYRGQVCEAFKSRARARELFPVEGDGAVIVVNGHHTAIEVTIGDGVLGTILGFNSEGIQLFAAEVLQCGDHVRAHALVRLGVNVPQVQIAAVYGAVVVFWNSRRGVRHHFNAASDAKIVHAAHDVGCGKIYRRDARSAKAIKGNG